MLPRLTVGFLVLTMAVGIASCSSAGVNQTLNIGPNFPTDSFYATNSTQNAISIYTVGQKSGSGPAYNIGGASTGLNGPRYIAFDSKNDLWVTNYNPSSKVAALIEIAALATGDVLPLLNAPLPGRPRGIAIQGETMVIASTLPTDSVPNQILLLTVGATSPYNTIGGANTGLSVPGGVSLDNDNNVYVTNLQQPVSVEKFIIPTASPTPKPTPTHSPSPTPSPSPSPSGSPSSSPSPSPSPTATPMNLKPSFVITGVTLPTGVALDTDGNVYVSDQGNPPAIPPSVLEFKKPKNGMLNITKPTRKIQCPVGNANKPATDMLNSPSDIAVDSNGNIYVADSTFQGQGILLVFAAAAKGGCTAPSTEFNSPGAVTGIGLVP